MMQYSLEVCSLKDIDNIASSPVCEGYWDSGLTPCPMVLSGRAERLCRWQSGQKQGHLLGPGCS